MSLWVLVYKAVSRSTFCFNLDVAVESIFYFLQSFGTLLIVYIFSILQRKSSISRTAHKLTSPESPAGNSWNLEARKAVTRWVFGRWRYEGSIFGRRCVFNVSLSASFSRERSTMVLEEEENRANVEQEDILSTSTDDLKAMPSRLQPILTQEFCMEPSPPVRNVAHDALDQYFEGPCDMSVGGNSYNREFEREQEAEDFFLEELNWYNIEKPRNLRRHGWTRA